MTESKKKQKAGKARPSSVKVVAKPSDDLPALLAEIYLNPTAQAAATVEALNARKDS